MGYIRATGLKGSRKQQVKIELDNETGKPIFKIAGEVETLGLDKRRKKNRDCVTLSRLSQTPHFDLTYNLSSRQLKIMYHGGVHYAYFPLDEEIYAKIAAAHELSAKPYGEEAPPSDLLLRWYSNEFRNKIIQARKRRFRQWNMRKARRNAGAPPPYKPHSKPKKKVAL
ncbi:MAG: hypothetical protein ABSA50_12930 [Candidatus Bathyarchaeia archaeon]|jgi:hypothetical protein